MYRCVMFWNWYYNYIMYNNKIFNCNLLYYMYIFVIKLFCKLFCKYYFIQNVKCIINKFMLINIGCVID